VKRKLLVIDTETSGLDPQKNSIMSLAAVVYHDGAIEDARRWLVLDAGGECDPAAMAVHGITRERMLDAGLSPWTVIHELQQMLAHHDMRGKVTLAGHNLAFDVGFLQRLYRLADLDYDGQFRHGGLCTKTAALLMEQAGRLNIVSSSLKEVALALSIKHEGAHDALEDALVTAQVLRRMIDRIR
jgi:DNA polymerase-3 subunit epsilon